MVDGDTPLLPFRRNPGSFWTTNEAMDWRLFGYDYPETQSANAASAKTRVAQLYSSGIRERISAGQMAGTGSDSVSDNGGVTFTDWVINAAAAPLELPPTFIVQFSLEDDVPDAVADVGMWSVLMPVEHNKAKRSFHDAEKLAKHTAMADMTMHGTVGLTSSLLDQVDAGKLLSLNEHDVVPFLQKKLTWRIYSVSL